MASKRTILITGCSDHSLGAALALAFHKAGWRVFASARNLDKMKGSKENGITTVQLDVGSDESVASGVARIKELTGGSLDALVNNAGAGYSVPLMDIDINKARELFDLNVFSILRVTRGFLPLLLESERGGLVINHTSVASMTAGSVPWQGAYNASKAAATSITEGLRLELGPFDIRVVNMLTGAVKSTFFDNASTPKLPPNSIYYVAKEEIESAMSGGDTAANGTDTVPWAESVVKDIDQRNPPLWISRGRYATQARLGSLLPIGTFDSTIKGLSKLDVVERKIKDQRSASLASCPVIVRPVVTSSSL
ncbi:IBR finger domain protein [Nemania serpens]|nr:IBR finger domain protein [Nemania serpens]